MKLHPLYLNSIRKERRTTFYPYPTLYWRQIRLVSHELTPFYFFIDKLL